MASGLALARRIENSDLPFSRFSHTYVEFLQLEKDLQLQEHDRAVFERQIEELKAQNDEITDRFRRMDDRIADIQSDLDALIRSLR
jgi:septal ring factor EnvC (AmiA/AmiB activator)